MGKVTKHRTDAIERHRLGQRFDERGAQHEQNAEAEYCHDKKHRLPAKAMHQFTA